MWATRRLAVPRVAVGARGITALCSGHPFHLALTSHVARSLAYLTKKPPVAATEVPTPNPSSDSAAAAAPRKSLYDKKSTGAASPSPSATSAAPTECDVIILGGGSGG